MKYNKKMKYNKTTQSSSIVLAACAAVYSVPAIAQDNGADAESLSDAISGGSLLLNVRTRYEHADQDGLEESNAFTLRTRMGWETAPLYGIKGMVEFEDVTILGSEDNYNQAGQSGAGRTVIADIEGTELNRATLSYGTENTNITLGRQRIILDNARFVGNIGWRQNEQTYDAVTLRNTSLSDTTLHYSYVDNVNRIFGDHHPKGEFGSDSHLINLSYSGLSVGTLTGYAYLIDLENAPGNSSDTFGISLTGKQSVGDSASINYRAEYASQSNAGDNPTDYDADYYRLELGGTSEGYSAGIGYEVLGSDNGKGFATPLATLHAHNGWADAFLATPTGGLEDLFIWGGVKIGGMPLKVVYHDYSANVGGGDFGSEWDLVLSRGIGDNWKAIAKYSHFDGDSLPDRDKLWIQAEYSF